VLVERRLLQEDPDGVAGREPGLAVGRLVETGHDLEDRGLPRTVRPDDADLGAGQEVHGDVVEDDLVAVRLARLVHAVDELSHVLGSTPHPHPGPGDATGRPTGQAYGLRAPRCPGRRPSRSRPYATGTASTAAPSVASCAPRSTARSGAPSAVSSSSGSEEPRARSAVEVRTTRVKSARPRMRS